MLTRLPPPTRRSPAVVARVLAEGFPHTRFPSADGTRALVSRLGRSDIAGGSVYDALVGATAAEYGLTLATRDRRALDTYRKLDVEVQLLD